VHYHIFGILTEADAQGNPVDTAVTYSAEGIDSIGEKLKDILRWHDNVHVEQVMRCTRELPPRVDVISCPMVLAPEIQETKYGHHWHLVNTTDKENPKSSYAACAHQLMHMETEADEKGDEYHLVRCSTRLGDDHRTVDECSCGFGKLLPTK